MEAMTYLPERGSLLIGLRNPLYKADKKSRKKAIAFELLNPAGLLRGKRRNLGRLCCGTFRSGG